MVTFSSTSFEKMVGQVYPQKGGAMMVSPISSSSLANIMDPANTVAIKNSTQVQEQPGNTKASTITKSLKHHQRSQANSTTANANNNSTQTTNKSSNNGGSTGQSVDIQV